MKRAFAVLTPLLALAASMAIAQAGPSVSGSISVNNENAASYATVALVTPQSYHALISCESSSAFSYCFGQAPKVSVTSTNSAGQYEFLYLQAGTYYVVANHNGHGVSSGELSVSGPVSDVDLNIYE